MNKKTAISIVLTLLMIASTFSAISVNANELTACDDPYNGGGTTEENLKVTKTVWNGCEWADSTDAELEDTIRFKIVVDYDQVLPAGYQAINLVVKDELPSCLEYANGAVITLGETKYYGESFVDGKTVYWNLSEDYEIILHLNLQDGPDVVSIEFNATVVDCGENVNNVYVTGKETCSQEPLYGHDDATVLVECYQCEPGIEVIKTVWNGTAWTEYVDGLTLGDLVKFKIEVIYTDCGSNYEILNMVVEDYLPCCLMFNSIIDITSTGDHMDEPGVLLADGHVVVCEWVFDRHIVLHDGDKLTIIFDAVFVDYCDVIGENWAYVEAWGCSGPTYEDSDNAMVDCTKEETTFEKLVWDEKAEEWVEEIETATHNTLLFKLELHYYGVEDLTDIHFYDELPCILEYSYGDYPNIEEMDNYVEYAEVSDDGKHIWWNLTDVTLKDGESIVIYFEAIVTGATGGDCPLCQCEQDAYNYANLWGRIGCTQDPNFFMEDEVLIHSDGNCPPSAPGVTGDTTAEVGEEIEIKVKTTDSDGDQVYYLIYWGEDYVGIPWVGPSNSSEEVTIKHTYTQAGVYEVYAKAKDENSGESDWSYYPHKITITQEPIQLCISLPRIVRGKISATIKNNGGDDLAGIIWEINATGGMLGKVKVNANGTIDLDSEASAVVNSSAGSVGFGIGRITGYVKITIGDYEKQVPIKGFLIGKIVLLSRPVTTPE